jgi:CheY-like chemotaxis protein
LVIDDDATSRALVCIQLNLLGIQDVLQADDGQQALQMLASLHTPPDCLVCDVFMPNRDGIELLTELAEQGFQGSIILMSGGDMQMLEIAGQIAVSQGLQVLATLPKPLALETLRLVLGLDATPA